MSPTRARTPRSLALVRCGSTDGNRVATDDLCHARRAQFRVGRLCEDRMDSDADRRDKSGTAQVAHGFDHRRIAVDLGQVCEAVQVRIDRDEPVEFA